MTDGSREYHCFSNTNSNYVQNFQSILRYELGSVHTSPLPESTGILHGRQFVSQFLHFQSSSLLLVKDSSSRLQAPAPSMQIISALTLCPVALWGMNHQMECVSLSHLLFKSTKAFIKICTYCTLAVTIIWISCSKRNIKLASSLTSGESFFLGHNIETEKKKEE